MTVSALVPTSAGLLLLARCRGGDHKVLLGLGKEGWSLLGGKTEEWGESPRGTALREFGEETGHCLSSAIMTELQSCAESTRSFNGGRYRLFSCDAASLSTRAQIALDLLPATFSRWRAAQVLGSSSADACCLEMTALGWWSLTSLQHLTELSPWLARLLRDPDFCALWTEEPLVITKQVNASIRISTRCPNSNISGNK